MPDRENDTTEAMPTAHNLWEYSRSRWPEYTRDDKTSNQADAAEYLERLIHESQNITNQVATKVEILHKPTLSTVRYLEMHTLNTFSELEKFQEHQKLMYRI